MPSSSSSDLIAWSALAAMLLLELEPVVASSAAPETYPRLLRLLRTYYLHADGPREIRTPGGLLINETASRLA
jgi:hypothetical protein